MKVADLFGNTILHDAVSANQYDVVKYLVEEKKVNPKQKNKAFITPLQLAKQERLDRIAELLK